MRRLGLINARGGSVGVPRKNVRNLMGRPLVSYAITAGLGAKSINRVVVSTDDPEIAQVARAWGADVPFMRPPALATSTSLQIDAIRHAVETLKSMGDDYDVVVILQPTCPLRTSADIDGAMELMLKKNGDSVISIAPVTGQHPLTMYSMSEDGVLNPLLQNQASLSGVLRQQFPDVWWRNGAIYGAQVSIVMEKYALYGERLVGYPMPVERSVNIDSPVDWIYAEALLKAALQDAT